MGLAVNAGEEVVFQELQVQPLWLQETVGSSTFAPLEDCKQSRWDVSHSAPQ